MKLIVRRKFNITVVTFCVIVETFIICETVISFQRIKIFLQEIIWKIWKVITEFFIVWIFYSETVLKLQKVFNIIDKFIMKNLLKSCSILILITQQTWLLISWLSISWLTIYNIYLVVWNILIIFSCIVFSFWFWEMFRRADRYY